MRSAFLAGIAAIVFLVPAAIGAEIEPKRYDVEMADGVHLATDVYLPDSGETKRPTILILTPYGRSGAKGAAKKMLAHGYAVVSQDIRGRGDSEGSNVVIFQSGGWLPPADGHTTLKWVAEQPWCDGNIATWGGSAVGITQNMLAPGAPDCLKAQFVEVAPSNLFAQCVYEGGAFRKSMMQGWLAATNMIKGNLDAFHSHQVYDDFWDSLNPEKYASRTVAPGIFVGGWYDIFCQGTINSFVSIQSEGGPAAKGQCRLIMGPWAHGTFDELKYPENASKRPEAADFLRYFDHHLKGESNGVADDAPVHYYVMGDTVEPGSPGNVWRTAASWPPPSDPTLFFLHAGGSLSETAPTGSDSKTYQYDPKNPVPTVGGQNLLLPKGPMDQRKVESRDDVLVFTTDKLEDPLEITGRITARLYVSSDCPDTDFTVKLTDVYPDGRSMLVTDGIRRVRYRNSVAMTELMTPKQVYLIEVDLWSTSLIVNRGHQLRVAVSSSNSPRFDPNPNTGKASWEEKNPRVATNTVYLSREYPSSVVLPVVGRTSDETAGGQ